MDIIKTKYADDDTTPLKRLFSMRLASLMLGLILGIILSFVTSRFEEVLLHDIKVAFFIPFVVYMAAAVGAQTQSIYVRDLKSGRANFKTYLIKESALGFFLGIVFSVLSSLVTWVWFKSAELSLVVALAMFGAMLIAPLVALTVAELLHKEHRDPALGVGPIATVIQDTLSVLIYGLVATAIIL